MLGILFIIFYIISIYNKLKQENYAKSLISSYDIMTLYSNSSNYTITKNEKEILNIDPFIIGLISIDKIGITYPILSSTNDDLLKICPCRFYGPMPNNIGNLCIAGHNYADNKIFGKLYLLDIGDIIDIYDLSGNKFSYIIYDNLEVESDDLSCLNQETNNLREITLVTCNTIVGNRHIIKAREI